MRHIDFYIQNEFPEAHEEAGQEGNEMLDDNVSENNQALGQLIYPE
jgi:hypothetical protein